MGRLVGNNIEQYQPESNGGGKYFSLKKDKETAKVRFLYESPEDIEGFTVHKVQVGDKDRYVNCLADEGECPFCDAKLPKTMKIFVPLFNEDSGQFQIWERGQTFFSTLSGLCAHLGNLVPRIIEVQRNGKPKDTKTTYNTFPIGDADGTVLEDILEDCEMDELPNPLGTIILEKTADEMNYYLENDEFPEKPTTTVRRRARAQAKEPDDLPFEIDEDEPAPTRNEKRSEGRSESRSERRTGRTRRQGRDMY